MIAYLATKGQFLSDAVGIEDVIRDAVIRELGLNIKKDSAEYNSWRNSLGNAMFHVLNTPLIPDDAGVAIEYRLKGRRQRIDVMISGFNPSGTRSVAVVELKQWSTILESSLPEHVVTWMGHREQALPHPSYQAWSYARLLADFYEVVSSEPIAMSPCAYVHNCDDDAVLRAVEMTDITSRAPVFIKGEHLELQEFIIDVVSQGDSGEGLRKIDESAILPSKQLVQSLNSMLEGHEEFVLIDEQKTAFESIMEFVAAVPVGEHQTLVIQGGPGTGKSVIAINALVKLLERGLNVRYVTKNAAPRGVYKQKLQKRSKKADISNLFVSSDAFYEVEKDSFDVLLVDEAHRLVKHSGLYGNLGDNQVAEIIQAARVSVFFVDESQKVTWRDIGNLDEIAGWADLLDSAMEIQDLSAQFRCAGSDEYLRWVDSILQIKDHPRPDLSATDYDIRILDSPSDLRDLIFECNKANNSSRLLAGYCWDWVSKKEASESDIVFPGTDFAMQWNLTKDGSTWMISPDSVNEVGCIHTCQGLEGDYMGVIIGDDLLVRNGKILTDPNARAKTDRSLRGWKTAAKVDREGTLVKTDELIRNTYRTLLTRGMKGTFIYCSDLETREYLRREFEIASSGASKEGGVANG